MPYFPRDQYINLTVSVWSIDLLLNNIIRKLVDTMSQEN
jgi:hypothetical protein